MDNDKKGVSILKISLYDRKASFMVVAGIIFMHGATLVLCAFWIYRFLILTYDPGVFFLLIMFLGILILCDWQLSRIQGFFRFLIRCNIDHIGIHCSIMGMKKWCIRWCDIRAYGTIGLDNQNYMNLIFFSTRKHQSPKPKELIYASEEQIVFQFRQGIWVTLKQYMPTDMSGNIQKSLDAGHDRFFTQK